MRTPIAEFNVQTVDGCLFKFLDLSYYTPSVWAWDFGDGATSTLQNPQHAYPNPGTYTVTLAVENKFGAGKSKSVTVVVGKEAKLEQVVNVIDGVGFLSGVLAHRYASTGSVVEG